jgi:hypothetical protein
MINSQTQKQDIEKLDALREVQKKENKIFNITKSI